MAIQARGLPRVQDLPPNTFFLDDSNTTLITYTQPFTQLQDDTCEGNTCTRLGSANASLEFSFNGADVWLFGKPGGIARIFLDGQLVDALDSSVLPNNGSALWAANNLNYGQHNVILKGVDGDTLNLIIDFFRVGGVVSVPSGTNTTTDPNYLPPEKLTPIIIGSLVGFFAVVAVIGIAIMMYLRRKKRRRISKSAIRLRSSDGSSGNVGRRGTLRRGSKSGVGGIFPWRSSTEKRPQIDLSGEEVGAEARSSGSTDAGNPFLRSQYAFANSNAMVTTYSPPASADASVPLFAHPASYEQQQQQQQQQRQKQHQRSISFIPEPTTAPPYSSVPTPPRQSPPQPPLEPQRQIQLDRLRVMNLASQQPSTTGPQNSLLPPERAPLTETPPPGYRQQPHPQPQPPYQDPASLHRPLEAVKPTDYTITNLPPRGIGGGSNWGAPNVSMASFSTNPTPAIIPTQQPQIPSAQSSMENSPLAIPNAPKSQSYESLPPSFRSFDPPHQAGPSTVTAPPPPPKPDNYTPRSPLSSMVKSLKGPRPLGGSNAQPLSAEERWGAQSGAGSLAGNGAGGVGRLRPENEDPESPIDPAVNARSQWY